MTFCPPLESASNCVSLGFHRTHEAVSYRDHATPIYGRGDEKDAGWKAFSNSALSYSYSARYFDREIPRSEYHRPRHRTSLLSLWLLGQHWGCTLFTSNLSCLVSTSAASLHAPAKVEHPGSIDGGTPKFLLRTNGSVFYSSGELLYFRADGRVAR